VLFINTFIKLYYKKQNGEIWCDKAIFPNGEVSYMKNDKIDLSVIEDYIGKEYIVTMDNEIVSVGVLKDYKKGDNGVGKFTLEPHKEKEGWWRT